MGLIGVANLPQVVNVGWRGLGHELYGLRATCPAEAEDLKLNVSPDSAACAAIARANANNWKAKRLRVVVRPK